MRLCHKTTKMAAIFMHLWLKNVKMRWKGPFWMVKCLLPFRFMAFFFIEVLGHFWVGNGHFVWSNANYHFGFGPCASSNLMTYPWASLQSKGCASFTKMWKWWQFSSARAIFGSKMTILDGKMQISIKVLGLVLPVTWWPILKPHSGPWDASISQKVEMVVFFVLSGHFWV